MVGRTISHYKILERLGSGSMGVVYKAHDLRLDRSVALKFLPPELTKDIEAKQRFLLEARAASALQHRNVCLVYDLDETEDAQLFISMEYIDGQTLQERLKGGPLPVQDAVNLAAQVAAGLARAHERGVVHRDLKPANVMIASDGTAKILDFGLAKTTDTSLQSGTALVLGTVAYMSPEQARGDTVDHRTDIWALGIVLYEMLSGRRPFQNDYPQAIIYALLHERHASLRILHPDIPIALETIIDRCLEKDRDRRFAHSSEVLHALETYRHDAQAPPEPPVKSIAVLAFTDISPDKENTYFSDGLTEEIITKLSRLQKVRVVSRGSVMHYERSGKSTRQIAAELRVQYLLEGSIRKHGSTLRITTSLIDAVQDAYLWSETYDGTVDQIFDIQEDVAGRIVKALKVRLTTTDRRTLKRRPTSNMGAFELYLKGRFHWSKRSKESLVAAIQYFEEAIKEDRRYAPAWAGIADAYMLLSGFMGPRRREGYAKAREATGKALAIDPHLAEAHTTLGLHAMLNEWDWGKAEREFKLAINASPNYVTAHHWYAEFLSLRGRFAEAMAEISRAVDLDPLSAATVKDHGMIRYYARDFDGAIDLGLKALSMDPAFSSAHRLLSLAYQAKGMFTESVAEHERWTSGTGVDDDKISALAQCLAAAGREEEALALIRRLPPRSTADGNVARSVGLTFVALGDFDEAFTWLGRAVDARAEAMSMMLVDPKLDPVRMDPRFASLRARAGLEH